MAHHWSEGVSTLRFTAREFQQELVDEALKHNLLSCPPSSAASFVSLKLIQELAYQIRRPQKRKTVILAPIHRLHSMAFELSHLTDLQTIALTLIEDCAEFNSVFEKHEVLTCTSEILEHLLTNNDITMQNINLLIIEQCHMIIDDVHLQKIMSIYMSMDSDEKSSNKPRILAFTHPLFSSSDKNNNRKNVIAYKNDANKCIKKYSNDIVLDRVAIFESKEIVSDLKDEVKLECLKGFTDLPCLDVDKDAMDMNSFRYWQTTSEDIPIEDQLSVDDKDVIDDSKEVDEVIECEKTAYDMLEYHIKKLENMLCCKADMASDIVGLKRITGKPKEVIVECKTLLDEDKCLERKQLEKFMISTVVQALMFLNDHRYDPTEIYGDEMFNDELQDIPNPCNEPKEMLELFLYILDQAGPYAADKAAFSLLIKLEKLKIKIPYERHFLILCLITSVFLQIRSAAELKFEKYSTEKDKILIFSTPKILRMMDVLKLFKPVDTNPKNLENTSKVNEGKTEKSTVQMGKSITINSIESKNRAKVLLNPDNVKDNHISNNKTGETDKSSETIIDALPSNIALNNCAEKNIENFNSSTNKYSSHVKQIENSAINPKCDTNCESQYKSSAKIRLSNESIDLHTNLEKTDNNESNCNNMAYRISCTSDTSFLNTAKISTLECNKRSINKNSINMALQEIDSCDFKELQKKIEMNCDIISLKYSNPDTELAKLIENTDYTEHTVDENKRKQSTIITNNKNINNDASCGKGDSTKAVKDSPSRKPEGGFRGRGRGRGGKGHGFQNRYYNNNNNDPDALCGLVFVEDSLMAKILSSIINEYCRFDENLRFVSAQYTIDKIADPLTDPKEAETEHKIQEEILKRFRTHECNLLIGTSFLEEGMDLPKCNLVIRWDIPDGYRSYARCRARARAPRSLYALLAPPSPLPLVSTLAQYSHIERMLIKNCGWREPPASEEADAARFSSLLESYRPSTAAVNLSSAVALLNRYCAKLPSDTFTRLVPLWTMEHIYYHGTCLYICTIRLPINCPLKHQIVGHPMPNRVLARRIAALQACKALHKAGELDDNLMPIGKEGFRAMESDWLSLPPVTDLPRCTPLIPNVGKSSQIDLYENQSAIDSSGQFEPRPGTTKRKQYYYKKVAQALTGCRPILGQPCLAYQINAWLACPLPERHNTRGRKLHPPEAYAEGFAILTSKPIQQIPVFPIFTRSGEVRVSLEKLSGGVIISQRRQKLIHNFMKYTFAEVLRVHNHLMVFDEDSKQSRNSFYIVPTTKVADLNGVSSVVIDWNFLELIYNQTNLTNTTKEKSSENDNINNQFNNKNINGFFENCKNNIDEYVDVVKTALNEETSEIDSVLVKTTDELKYSDDLIDLNTVIVKNQKNAKLCDVIDKDDNLFIKNQNDASNDDNKNCLELIETGQCVVHVRNDIDDDAFSQDLEEILPNPYLAPGETFTFDSEKFRDAVVMPWYRNQDQPQYFYVAEICWQLSPRSAFPSTQHATFEQYYRRKYGAIITQPTQPLLDVDHTSARLNLLTPRFVNRKGVALPTSSERTKRAKRESLEQKQILVPELCCAHPFRGALWRAAVALPCVLYRINSLLLADEIRRSVAICVALGTPKPDPKFEWPSLDFGWSLAEVLAGDNCKDSKIDEDESVQQSQNPNLELEEEKNKPDNNSPIDVDPQEKSANEIIKEKEAEIEGETGELFEIGMWSNDMAASVPEPESTDCDDDDLIPPNYKLPDNVTMCPSIGGGADWSLSGIESPPPARTPPRSSRKYSIADSDASYISSDYDAMSDGVSNISDSDSDDVDMNINALDTLDNEKGGIRIEFKSGNEAEAIEIPSTNIVEKLDTVETVNSVLQKEAEENSMKLFNNFFYSCNIEDEEIKKHIKNFETSIALNKANLMKNGILVTHDKSLEYLKLQPSSVTLSNSDVNNEVPSIILDSSIDNNSLNTEISGCEKYNKSDVDNKLMQNNLLHSYVEDDDVNPFPELLKMALSKNELINLYDEMFPYDLLSADAADWENFGVFENGSVTLDNLEKSKRKILSQVKLSMPREEWLKYNFFSMKDLGDDDFENEFDNRKEFSIHSDVVDDENMCVDKSSNFSFSFDHQPNLYNHPGPSPSLILQALTMSNANDGINLERLETIGDSFLKYAITTYLYCTYQNIHEGKLSHLRSKQVSNLNLYRLGRRKSLGSRMVAYKFEPYDNWLPPCHRVPPHLERALIDTHIPSSLWNIADMPPLIGLSKDQIEKLVKEKVSYHSIPSRNNNSDENNILIDENCIYHGKNKKIMNNSNDANEKCDDLNSEAAETSKIMSMKCTCTKIDKHVDYEKDLSLINLKEGEYVELEGVPCFVPYNLITQHSIPDKSIADCVEALIGAYLIECGPRGALLFMAWLGIRVLPKEEIVLSPDHPFVKMMEQSKKTKKEENKFMHIDGPIDKDDSECDEQVEVVDDDEDSAEQDPYDNQDDNNDFDDNNWNWEGRIPGSLRPEKNEDGQWIQVTYGELKPPPSPLLRYVPDPEGELIQMLSGYEGLERTLGYRFKDRCYLLQAMTHASYSPNRLTDCYQRLEFLGDAVLDYLITRQLYEDPRRHSPGALTDLRSALVNNTIFASLAVRHGMHKYFRHLSPGLNEVIARFVKIQEENGHSISEEDYLIQEDECEQAEDVEVPKALGDLFESIAGAIFLDSGMSLDAVWRVYHALMQREIEAFSESVPKSPVRELLEMEPETAKFGKPEKLADGRRVRVTVEVLGVGIFKGVGRNYRIAKCTAAKCALRRLISTNTRRHKNKA